MDTQRAAQEQACLSAPHSKRLAMGQGGGARTADGEPKKERLLNRAGKYDMFDI